MPLGWGLHRLLPLTLYITPRPTPLQLLCGPLPISRFWLQKPQAAVTWWGLLLQLSWGTSVCESLPQCLNGIPGRAYPASMRIPSPAPGRKMAHGCDPLPVWTGWAACLLLPLNPSSSSRSPARSGHSRHVGLPGWPSVSSLSGAGPGLVPSLWSASLARHGRDAEGQVPGPVAQGSWHRLPDLPPGISRPQPLPCWRCPSPSRCPILWTCPLSPELRRLRG